MANANEEDLMNPPPRLARTPPRGARFQQAGRGQQLGPVQEEPNIRFFQDEDDDEVFLNANVDGLGNLGAGAGARDPNARPQEPPRDPPRQRDPPRDPPRDPHVGHLGDPDPNLPPRQQRVRFAQPEQLPQPPQQPQFAPPPHINFPVPPNAGPNVDLNQLAFLQFLAQFIGNAVPQPAPVVEPPEPQPNVDDDILYMEQVNEALEQIDINAPVVRPIIPPRALAGQNGPVAGADTTRQLQRRNIDLTDLLTRQTILTNNLVYRIGNQMPPATVELLRQQAAEATQTALDLRLQARRQNIQLQDAARIHDRYNLVAIMPNYQNIVGQPARVKAGDVQNACGIFNPEDPKSDFGKVWNALRYYGRDCNWQEMHYQHAMSLCLLGDAKDLYNQHRDMNVPFEQTIQALYQAYARPRSIQDDKQAIMSIVRQPGESIAQCVARGEIQIDKQQLIHPPHKWPIIRETLVHEMLVNIILPETQSHLTYLENESIEITGQTCDIFKLITELDKYELKHNLRPKTPMKPTFHSAHTGVFDKQNTASQTKYTPKGPPVKDIFNVNNVETKQKSQKDSRDRPDKKSYDKNKSAQSNKT
jgi:hypothetical protein